MNEHEKAERKSRERIDAAAQAIFASYVKRAAASHLLFAQRWHELSSGEKESWRGIAFDGLKAAQGVDRA